MFRLLFARSHGLVLFLVLVAVTCAVIATNPGWQSQWFWATSRAMAATIVVAPVLAGVTAFLVQQRLSPSARILAAAAPRGTSGVLVLAAVPWCAALAAVTLGLGFVSVRTTLHLGLFAPPWLLVAHGVVALTSACLLGVAGGVSIPNLAAGPLTALVAYVGPILLIPLGVEGLLAAGGASGPAFGMEPDPATFGMMIVVNVLLGAVCAAVVIVRLRPVSRRWWWVVGALSIGLVVAGSALSANDPRMTSLRPVSAAPVCIGDSTRMCGPADSRHLLEMAHRDVAAARATLAEHGIETVPEYEFLPDPQQAGVGVGILTAEPSAFLSGHLSRWDVAVTVATPSVCPEYFDTMAPTGLLDAQARLAAWVVDVLDGHAVHGDAADATATYDALRACDDSALPDWSYDGW